MTLPQPTACDDSDTEFMNALRLYYETGFLSEELRWVPPEDELARMSRGEEVDDEVDRCPAATIARLFFWSEVLSPHGFEQRVVASDLHVLADLLQEAAKARNSLSVAPSRDPGSLVMEANMRSRVAISLHQTGELYMKPVLAAVTSHGPGDKGPRPCVADMYRFIQCLLIDRSGGRDSMFQFRLLAAEPHGKAMAAKYGVVAQQLTFVGHLVFAAGPGRGARRHLHAAMELFRSLRRDPEVPNGNKANFAHALRGLQSDATNTSSHGYAEGGKEAFIAEVLQRAGIKTKFYVEIGTGDGTECNTRWLREQHGWRGVLLDQVAKNPEIGLHQRFLTAGNINRVLSELRVPGEFDLLSIDVDDNDFWLWRALSPRFSPRVVIVEYVDSLGDMDIVNRYLPGGLSFSGSNMRHLPLIGASLRALTNLAHVKGYRLAKVAGGYDGIFVREDLWPAEAEEELPRLPTHPALHALLEDDFHTTSARALAEGRAIAVHHAWTQPCIQEVFEHYCLPGSRFADLCASG